MSEGIDYSWARPGAEAIRNAGKTFIMRYLYPDEQGGKGLDLSEVQDARANGLLIGTVYESSGSRALDGYAAGQADAHTSAGQLSALGMDGNVVYFAVDFDATPDQYETIGQYLDGAASVLGKNKVGLYAGVGPIDALCGGARADYGWQTYAWSGGRVSGNANVYQYLNGQTLNGGGVDLCRNLKDDFGAFGGTVPASSGAGGAPLATNLTSSSWSDIQTLLNSFGFGLTVDNIDGPNTTAAVGKFQSDHGLAVDYAVGPLTLAALNNVPASTAVVGSAPAFPLPGGSYFGPKSGPVESVSGYFSHNGDLKLWQQRMHDRGWAISVDGLYGDQTAAIVRSFQSEKGLSVDSLIGPGTWAAAWTAPVT